MHYKSVHREGPSFSRIITGVWRWQELSTAETENLIRTSLDCGIRIGKFQGVIAAQTPIGPYRSVLTERASSRVASASADTISSSSAAKPSAQELASPTASGSGLPISRDASSPSLRASAFSRTAAGRRTPARCSVVNAAHPRCA